jgi:Tol biopolymer transport system component
MAQPLQAVTYDPSGEPVPIAVPVGGAVNYGYFAASDGTLAYRSASEGEPLRLQWFDRGGRVLSTLGTPGHYLHLALSPDGRRVAVVQDDDKIPNRDLWIMDVARNIFTRFTFDETEDTDAVWSPDGLKVAFSSRRRGPSALYVKDADGARPEEALTETPSGDRPRDWSADARFLLFARTRNSRGVSAIWTMSDPLGDPSKRKVSVYLESPYNLTFPQFAPGAGGPRWVAYCSDESRRSSEVFVQSFPAGGAKIQISNGGGTQPRWRRDGKELFYLTPDGKVMAVDVTIGTSLAAGAPRLLFDTHSPATALFSWRYDVSPDGQRFLVISPVQNDSAAPELMTVVTNWRTELKR